MKIIFDVDGTLTDFNKYINDNAIGYFIKKYDMTVKHPNSLEIEEIFDIDNFFQSKYKCNLATAKKYTKKALNKYWINFRFVKFSLFGKFRKGARTFLKVCKKNGHKIEIHTSRAKASENTVIGAVCRLFTYLQFKLNGASLSRKAFYFYKTDEDKVIGIINSHPEVVFEDKPSIISKLTEKKIKTFCMQGTHNTDIQEEKYLAKISNFDYNEMNTAFDKLMGRKNYQALNRAAKSDLFFNKLRITIPTIHSMFKPIVLHKENIMSDNSCAIVIAPNHRSTLDPIIITSIINRNIHWMALKRFFDGNDSIFNNNKNPILCKITSISFKKLEYFPIERLTDNPGANNLNSLKDVNIFLKNKQYVGIFPEGTTNKSKKDDFGDFDPTFIKMAKKNKAYIQPITILWVDKSASSKQVIVNIGNPFDVSQITLEEAYEKYVAMQKQQLTENKLKAKEEDLSYLTDKS